MAAARLLALLFCCILSRPEAAEPPLANQLAGHPSPYLALHATDPVHWQLWQEPAFARARREGKLLFVSSGYFSCHWCHVMQQESFRDARIAAFINRHFVPVKIDRQLLPVVDAALVDFTERTRGQAGWPLNLFVTPEGYPLLGSLYLPAEDFEALLRRLSERWAQQRAPLTAMARAAAQATTPAVREDIDVTPGDLWRRLRAVALRNADELQGGFGAQAKFPMAPQLLMLLQAQQREPQDDLGGFLRLTLRQMADGGLQDQLGGGFFRYTTDPDWRTPHFEKMLYDNAQLARVYLQAARVLAAPEFLAIARRTLDFVLDNLAAPEGGYSAALSAVDAVGVEGGGYLWDAAEIERLAGVQWPLVRRYWGLERAAPFAAGHLPVPMRPPAQLADEFDLPVAEVETRLQTLRARLLQRRAQRPMPVDTQVLAGWNGLLLWALADAVEDLGSGAAGGRYARAAAALHQVLLQRFVIEGELVRARRGTAMVSAATLEDHAYVVTGLLRWQTLSHPGAESGVQTRWLVEQAWQRYSAAGRWRLGEDSLLRWGRGEAALADGALPSPHALLLAASRQADVRTVQVTGALRAARPWVQADPFAYASYVALYP